MLKFFRKKSKPEPPVNELPRAREELLLGDTNRTWTINDFVISYKLTCLYDEIDRSLALIFEKGNLDAANGDLFDGAIDAACVIAQNELNGQYTLRPEGINKMVAWRERDVSDLRCQLEAHKKNIFNAQKNLEKYIQQLDRLNFKNRKGA